MYKNLLTLTVFFILTACGSNSTPATTDICKANPAEPLCNRVVIAETKIAENMPVNNNDAESMDVNDNDAKNMPVNDNVAENMDACPMGEVRIEGKCQPVEGHVTAGVWVQSFVDIPLTTAPNPTDTENKFLQGTATGLNDGGYITDYAGILTLASNNLGGDARDGVAFFEASPDKNLFSYAGILSTTNLGAPLEIEPAVDGQDAIVEWDGKFRSSNAGFFTAPSFNLMVNLTNRMLDAIVPSPHPQSNDAFTIDGIFDEKGVITGTVQYANYTDNTDRDTLIPDNYTTEVLTGLIGQDGAVGVFINDDSAINTRVVGLSPVRQVNKIERGIK